jgi:hypothetical protein
MTRVLTNIAASVHERLLNGARERAEDFNLTLKRYAGERFLYRLGQSRHRDRYVLKGAALFAVWGGDLYRATRDLDFTGYGSSDAATVLEAFREICSHPVADDGLIFDTGSLAAEPIRDSSEYDGLRVTCTARLGRAPIALQVDLGFGDAIEPAARDVDYPTLLDAPAPRVRVYPREAVVAEKLHAMVTLGERNTRFKDFYDVHVLAGRFGFEGAPVARAIAATFDRRRTAIVAAFPACLTARFFADGSRADQWRAYLTRSGLRGAPADYAVVGQMLQAFLGPVWSALGANEAFLSARRPGGPWEAGA